MIIGGLVRIGVVAGLIIYSNHLGIWDSPERTQEIFDRSREQAVPLTGQVGCDWPKMPSDGKLEFIGVYIYNTTVKTIFYVVNWLPTKLGEIIDATPGLVSSAYGNYKKHSDEQKARENDRKIYDVKPKCKPGCKGRKEQQRVQPPPEEYMPYYGPPQSDLEDMPKQNHRSTCKKRREREERREKRNVNSKRKAVVIPEPKCRCRDKNDKSQKTPKRKDDNGVVHEDYHYYKRQEKSNCKCKEQ